MTMDELEGRLNLIERLLTVVLSSPAYLPALEAMDREIYDEVGQRLNRLFPSDPEYTVLHTELEGFRSVAAAARSLCD
jgi:hypothetical protein